MRNTAKSGRKNVFEALESRTLMSVSPLVLPHVPGLSPTVAPGTPAAPSGLSAVYAASTVQLHWSDNSTGETGFVIQQYRSGTGFITLETVPANTTHFSVTNPSTGLNTFQVLAFNAMGRGTASNQAAVAVNSTSVVTVIAPTTVRTQPLADGGILLTWDGDLGATTGYTIQKSVGSKNAWTTIGTAAVHDRTFADSHLTRNAKVFYRVVANGAAGASATSDPVAVFLLSV